MRYNINIDPTTVEGKKILDNRAKNIKYFIIGMIIFGIVVLIGVVLFYNNAKSEQDAFMKQGLADQATFMDNAKSKQAAFMKQGLAGQATFMDNARDDQAAFMKKNKF
jgi:hypothetical protein